MKQHICILLAGLCLLLSGCGTLEENLEKNQLTPSVETVSPSAEPAPVSEPPALPSADVTFPLPTEPAETGNLEGLQTVGTEEFGYVSIPDDWLRFYDLDGGTDFQYSDPTHACIITLNVFSDEGLTEEQKAQLTDELAAQSLWYNLEQNGVQDIQGAHVTLNGIPALQVYGVFTSEDYDQTSIIVCWTFQSEDGVLHYVAAEAPVEQSLEVVGYVENSYILDSPEQTE